ncbi:hypothetical protein SAMN04487985_1411, partial [Aerococcus urinaehominis]
YKPVVEKGKDGITTIKFYPVDPSTGEPDKTKDPVATGEVKDGAKGEKGDKGQDGKSVTVQTEPGNFQGQTGVWIIVRDRQTGQELDRDFVANGKDGKDGNSSEITTEPITDTNGKELGYKITITHPDGRQEARIINHGRDGQDGKDGVDGKSIIATVERGDYNGKSGAWVIIRDRDSLQEIDREFIADGEDGKTPTISSKDTETGVEITINNPDGTSHTHIIRDGRDGKDGKDGQSITATTEPGSFNGQTGVWIIIRDRQTGQELDRDFVADGKDGKDGKSSTLTTEPVVDRDGNEIGVTIRITHPDGSTETRTIYHGRDGKDGKDGKDGETPQVRTEPGKDSQGHTGHWLIISRPNGDEIVREFIRDGKDGNDGKDGKDGVDGKTPSVKVEPGKNEKGESGQWIIIYD